MPFTIPAIPDDVLSTIHSPSMIVFANRVRDNIDHLIQVAGNVERLRPHCKTHKMAAVIGLLMERGILKHKAATIAEVEMLVDAGAMDVVLAYNLVGPNIDRVVTLLEKHSQLKLAVTADHPVPLLQLSAALASRGLTVGVMLDIDVGQHRTGVAADSALALELFQQITELPGVTFAGFHVYDGHQHQESLSERTAAVASEWPAVLELKQKCSAAGIAVPEILCGGSPTFPVYAEMDEPAITLSPGTSIFHDSGYGGHFPDLDFQPAAVVITRVISRPTSDRVTLDLGNKAVAADPPKGQRVHFPLLPDAVQVIHNEEHLVLETNSAADFQPGDVLLGIPTHICPTSALHQSVTVIEDEKIVDCWEVTARNRRITI